MMILADEHTTDSCGNCYAMSFVYSGNFKGEALKDQFGQTRALLGLQDEMFSYPLETYGKNISTTRRWTYICDLPIRR